MFETRQAKTAEELDEVFRLRYQVYCLENHFLDVDDNPNEREVDVYDDLSEHTLLIHRPSGLIIGSARVILPNVDNCHNSFPMQEVCNIPQFLSREEVLSSCEVSRFCISKSQRNRVEDTSQYTAVYDIVASQEIDAKTKKTIPYTSLGLLKGVTSIAINNGMSEVYAVMEPKLIRFIVKLGGEFEQVGEEVEYHGLRIPSKFQPLNLYNKIYKNNPELWNYLTDDGHFHEMALKNTRRAS